MKSLYTFALGTTFAALGLFLAPLLAIAAFGIFLSVVTRNSAGAIVGTLVYELVHVERAEGGRAVTIRMTLTAPGCGMGPAIAEDAKSKILLVPGVSAADVRITWDPPWNQSMISEEGKMKLGLI